MHVLNDSWTALAYFFLPVLITALCLFRRNTATRLIAISLIAVPLICGLTHLAAFFVTGEPMQSLQAAVELMAGAIGVAVTTLLWSTPCDQRKTDGIGLAKENDGLRTELERRRTNESYLRSTYEELERQVETTTTALSLAYKKLNANRQRLAFALEGANDGFWDWTLKDDQIYFSLRLAEMLGHGQSEMTVSVKKRWMLIHQDDRARALKAFHGHIEGKSDLYESEHRLRTENGAYIWILDRGKVVERDRLGRAVRAVGTTSDISRRKAMELELQASNKQIRRLYEQTPALLYSVDGEGRLLSVTRHWLAAMGYVESEVLGRRSIDFMTAETGERITNEALPVFREAGWIENVPCQMVRKNGEIFDAVLSATSEHDDDGRTVRSLAVLVDVTERNAALASLQRSEARLRMALEGAREGLWDWNVETGELYLSPEAGSILGLAADDLPDDIGFWKMLVPEADRERFAAGLDDLSTGRVPSLVCEQELMPSGSGSIWIDWRASGIEGGPGRAARRIVGIFRDITARKRAELKTAYRALHDGLTGLPNRMAYEEQLQRAHVEAELTGRQLAVMFLDLDRFKAVNDNFGHDCGDRLLVEVGSRLQRCLRKSDLVARFGGDEFAILARGYKGPGDVTRLAQRIIKTITQPITIDREQVEIGVSIGITSYPEDRSPAEDLITNADLALYRAKQSGRGTWQRFHPSMPSRRGNHPPSSDAMLYDALEGGEFQLWYQPILRADDLSIQALEAMIRWDHPKRGELETDAFMPEILNSPFLRRLVEWGLQSAVEQLAAWRDLGLSPGIGLSMDLPTPLLHAQNLPDTFERTMVQIGLDPASLTLEMTEDALSQELIEAGVFKRLHQRRIGIAIDDFGAGTSSLSRLARLPIERLKIHESLTASLLKTDEEGGSEQALTSSIITLAMNLGITPIAVQVENAEQRNRLMELSCTHMQGPLFANPAKAADATRWISGWQERCQHDQKLDLLRHA